MYILYSEKLDKYYIGACIDVDRRLYQHNNGHTKFTSAGLPWQLLYTEENGHTKFTSTGLPWQLLYTEEFDTLEVAKKREFQLKKMKSRKYIEELIAKRIR